MENNREKGFIGEEYASRYLLAKGYKILDRNYRSRIGEIDIVAIKDELLIFIEVKARTTMNYGYPYEAVNRRKRAKIIKSSYLYMKEKHIGDLQFRYDIIEVYLFDKPRINHIENAFNN